MNQNENENERTKPSLPIVASDSAGRVAIDVTVDAQSETQFFAGLGGDVARGGVFVATYRALPVGAAVRVRCFVEDAIVEARGIVCWRIDVTTGAPPGLGICFTEPPRGLEALLAFASRHPPLYMDDDSPTLRAARRGIA